MKLQHLTPKVPPESITLLKDWVFAEHTHYHGTPSGFPGMGLTLIAGWIFGLAMVETRSIPLPWFLHFVPDVVIYVTSALQN
jgi:hypothetical protein